MNLAAYLLLICISFTALAERADHYDELVDYVQEAPDQAEAATCLYMANTGAMELLANKKNGIKNPLPYGTFDLAEIHLYHSPRLRGTNFFTPVLNFNQTRQGIHTSHWPFEAWRDGEVNRSVWKRHPQMNSLPKIDLPEVETIKLFQFGNKWTTNVLDSSHIEMIKNALWKYQSPVLVNYNDNGFWHVILIVGYDDRLPGACYETEESECNSDIGSFYVRDSFGVRVELRDYDWLRVKGNAAFVVKLK